MVLDALPGRQDHVSHLDVDPLAAVDRARVDYLTCPGRTRPSAQLFTSATNAPAPCRRTTSPSATSTSYARLTVFRETLICSHSSLSLGSAALVRGDLV
jgi:hypothetical protein